MEQFIKERNEALLSLNQSKIIAYMKKYGVEIPSCDEVFWLGVHKAILQIAGLTKEQYKRSYDYLKERGSVTPNEFYSED